MRSDIVENYLTAIGSPKQSGETPVSTARIAEYLNETQLTATTTIKRLVEQDPLECEKYNGSSLAEESET